MLLYQTDRSGFLVGPVEAIESPLEPGVFLIPAGCIEAQPPALGEGQRARWDGEGWAIVEPEPDPEPEPLTLDDYRHAIQSHVDAVARQRNYEGGVACASYANSTLPAWAGEAAAFIAWRDAVWVYVFTELAKVENSEREQPTIPALLAELPAIDWPA